MKTVLFCLLVLNRRNLTRICRNRDSNVWKGNWMFYIIIFGTSQLRCSLFCVTNSLIRWSRGFPKWHSIECLCLYLLNSKWCFLNKSKCLMNVGGCCQSNKRDGWASTAQHNTAQKKEETERKIVHLNIFRWCDWMRPHASACT